MGSGDFAQSAGWHPDGCGMEGWLWKLGRGNSFIGSREKRRWFVLADGGTLLSYFPSDIGAGPPARSFQVVGALVLVNKTDFAFSVEMDGRLLTLRAAYDVDRSGWVRALLGAGAQPHPQTRYLAAHSTSSRRESAKRESVKRESVKRESCSRRGSQSNGGTRNPLHELPGATLSPLQIAGSARTLVEVPAGLQAGDQFNVTVPTGQRMLVRIPANPSGGALEVRHAHPPNHPPYPCLSGPCCLFSALPHRRSSLPPPV